MKLFRLVTGWASALMTAVFLLAAPGPVEWDQPAAALAEQIAGVIGPGQVALTVRNLSSIAASDIPAIRALLEKDLKAHGITIANGDSANTIRITFSQNDRERLWVGEVIQGTASRVVMVAAGSGPAQSSAVADYMTLRRERLPILHSPSFDPAMAAMESASSLLILRPEAIDLLAFDEGGWQHQKYVPSRRPSATGQRRTRNHLRCRGWI